MLVPDDDADSFECFNGVLISAELCRMSQLACPCRMTMQIPLNVFARVLMSSDVCRMSELACSFPMQMYSRASSQRANQDIFILLYGHTHILR